MMYFTQARTHAHSLTHSAKVTQASAASAAQQQPWFLRTVGLCTAAEKVYAD